MLGFDKLDFQQILSTFLVLIGIIDIIGSIPIILQLKAKGKTVSANKATFLSWGLMVGFFYGGNFILKLFGCNIQSFAVAGSILIFFMALEMILDIEIFKNNGPVKEATLVPLVFPLLAGAGTFTTLISLKSMYADINIMIALALNMAWVYIVIKATDFHLNGHLGEAVLRQRGFAHIINIIRYLFISQVLLTPA